MQFFSCFGNEFAIVSSKLHFCIIWLVHWRFLRLFIWIFHLQDPVIPHLFISLLPHLLLHRRQLLCLSLVYNHTSLMSDLFSVKTKIISMERLLSISYFKLPCTFRIFPNCEGKLFEKVFSFCFPISCWVLNNGGG